METKCYKCKKAILPLPHTSRDGINFICSVCKFDEYQKFFDSIQIPKHPKLKLIQGGKK